MTIAQNVLQAIGSTPLIRLNRASQATGCEILGKAEFMNPGALGQGSGCPLHCP